MGAIRFDIGVKLTSSQFSRAHEEVVARALAAGVHPHDGSSWTPAVAEAIYTLAGEPQVVAIGECGLDFNRNFSTPHEQEV
ncbi:TatD family hydrolase, partial [Klebsiella pneumoniae]|uniref:TatD family hydrolase n=1 Tax=Klebsiella pneumoniae TaxID=573 RepID=UPI002157C43E